MKLEFMDTFYLADCAARLLAQERPSKDGAAFMRKHPVGALRALWKTGNRDTRRSVCARVHLWLGTPKDRMDRAYARITG